MRQFARSTALPAIRGHGIGDTNIKGYGQTPIPQANSIWGVYQKNRTLHHYFITNTIYDGQQNNGHRKVLQR